jgi:hypothetical protein
MDDYYVLLFMEWHLISLIFQDPYLLKRPIKNRSSAQGLFMMMTNGFGCGFRKFTSMGY